MARQLKKTAQKNNSKTRKHEKITIINAAIIYEYGKCTRKSA